MAEISEKNPKPIVALSFMAALMVILPIEGTAGIRNILLLFTLIAFGIHVWKTGTANQLAFPLKSLWGFYAALALVGLLWAVNVPYSLNEIKHEIVISALFFGLAYNLYKRAGILNWLVSPVLIGNAFLVLYCLVVWVSGGTTVDGLNGTFKTGVGNFSTYLATVFPVLVLGLHLAWKQKSNGRAGLILGLVLCNLAAMYATQNRQVFAALFVEILAFVLINTAVLKKPWALISVLTLTVVCSGLFAVQLLNRGLPKESAVISNVQQSMEDDGRLPHWRFALSESANRPLHGGGFGRNTFKNLYPDHEMTTGYYVHLHNTLMNRLAQMGYPGVMAFLALFLGVAWVLWQGKNKSDQASVLAVTGIGIAAGVLSKNMTDDFFMRELGYLYWVLGAALLGLQQSPTAGLKTDKFLIIRRDNIGDLLCTTPLMRALRQRYPMARIDALVNSYNAPVLANNPDLSHIYAYTKAKHRADEETVLGVHWRRIKLMWQLRQTQYDVVILAGDGNIDRQLSLARWLNAAQVIGFVPDDGKPRKGLDIVVPKLDMGHEVERTFSLLAPLGITGEPPEMVLVPDEKEGERAHDEINQVSGSPTIAIHISARKIPQRWPLDRFSELMHTIHANSGARFVLLWSPGDENNPLHPGDDQKAAALQALVQDLPVVACPTHTLAELIAVLSVCDQMICSDGGAMHIGAALGLPIIALFGNSDAERWHPWRVDHTVLQTPDRDVSSLRAEVILMALQGARWREGPIPQ